MSFQKFFKSVGKKAPFQRKLARSSRLLVEVLEDRIVPTNFTAGDLVVLQAAASASNTTASILEIDPSTPNQASPALTLGISGTGANAIRISGSASSTGYLSDSNDGSYVVFAGANSTNTSANANTLNPRAPVVVDNSTNVTLPTTYTGGSGNQTRGATTLDDSNWFVGDQGGIYTNGASAGSPTGNFRSVKAFGGIVYGFIASASSPAVGTLSSPSGSTFTPLPGLPNGTSNAQDFYLIQSGSNGSTFDVLYALSASSATAGTIAKYSLVSGAWTANGSYTTTFGGFGLAAASNGSGGASLYVTTGTGATAANQVLELTDTAGFNTAINITTANNVTLFTAPAGTLLKGIAFAPVANTATTTAVTSVTPLSTSNAIPITFTATVTANSGSIAPVGGIVEFIDSGASGTVLATAATAVTSGTTSTFTVSTTVPGGTYGNIQAYYIANVGSNFSSSVSPAFGSTLSVGTATTTAITSISPSSTTAGQPVTFTATVSATAGSTAPTAGSVQFRDGGATGTLLATASSEIVSGTTATFTVTSSSIAPGNYSNIQAFYIAGAGFVSGNSPVFGSTLAITPAGVIAEWAFPSTASSPDNSPAPTFGAGTAITLGMTNSYNGGNAASDDVVLTAGTANPAVSENTWRIRGATNNGWATAAAGAAEYSQGIELDTSTVGHSNIVFSFDWYATTTSIRDLQVQYNTNTANPNGWTNYAGPSPTGTFVATPNDYFNAGLSPARPTIFVNLSGIAAVNNDPNLGIRLVSAFDSTGHVPNDYASAALTSGHTVLYANGSGNWRFGNLTFAYGTTTSTVVTASPTSSQSFGGNVTFTATVTPASGGINPTGTVAFFDGATQIGATQTLTSGAGTTATASVSVSTLSVGTHNITAQFVAASGSGFINSGSSMNLAAGTNPLAYNITGIGTNSVLTANVPAQQPLFTSITFTDTITPVSGVAFPTGTVKFFDGSTQIGATQTVVAGTGNAGTASITLNTLALGSHAITAQFFPTGNFAGNTSSPLNETIISSLTTPIISEFLASNQDVLLDAAGQSSDWIEVFNPSATPIDLFTYSLTDNASDLTKWQFPHVTVPSQGFLIVFADGANITTGTELHTNFSLGASGEYLGLVDPNGVIVSQYSPQFPQQVGDISYGVNFNSTNLVNPGAAAQTLIPANNALGTSWTAPSFVPTGWTSGTTGVGFGILQPGFNVNYIQANESIPTVETAQQIISTPSLQTTVANTNVPSINYLGTGSAGDFSGDVAYPTQTIGVEVDDFLIQATGAITIPTAGNWSFAVNSDDGFILTLSQGSTTFTSEFDGLRGAADTVATFNIPQTGSWNVSLIAFQNAGGAEAEFSAAQGVHSTFTPGTFQLVGDTAHGGLAVNSVPGGASGFVLGTNVASAMQNINSSAYVRIPFTVSNPAAFNQLELNMLYNDGFVAYLNGVEVASSNAPATLAYNSTATAQRSIADTVTPAGFSLTPYLNLLQTGTNVLAIQGLNSAASDGSFLVLPQLIGSNINTAQDSYFTTPTPGAANSNPAPGVVNPVVASIPDGFYSNSFTVTLTTTTPGATIYYTLNGNAPTPTTGTAYAGPITISGTTTLRAEAFETGYIPLPSVSWTYIFVTDVIDQSPHDGTGLPTLGAAPPGWPSSWGPNAVFYGMDQTIVSQEGASTVEAALQSLPVVAISTDLSNLFDPSTGIYANANVSGVKVPASIELINPDGTPGFQIDAGLSIRGGFSREAGNPKHSFHISFGASYGASTLDYPLFGTGPGVATSFQGIDLRTAQNNSWNTGGDPNMTMMEDPFERASMGAMGQITTHSIWINVFIDGQYWGVYEIEERINPLFASTYLGQPQTDTYDILRAENGSYQIGVVDGNTNAYFQLWQYVTTHDMSNDANYYFLQGKDANGVDDPSIPNSDVLLDVADLIDYMIDVYQGGNQDAPISSFIGNVGINNFFTMRDENGRQGFVFLQHDSEWTLQSVSADRIGPYNAGGPGDFSHFNPQYLFQVLTANTEFRQAFADEVQAQFTGNGAMTNANMLARYQANANAISLAINGEAARWGGSQSPTNPLTRTDWVNAVNNQENVLLNRNPVVLQQFVGAGWIPSLAAPEFLVNGSPQDSGEITPGSLLTFANTGGVIYFTTDGSDPRLIGGGINPLAQVYTPGQSNPALVLNASTELNARALSGTTWSALSKAVLSTAVPATAGNLAVTELQYDPLADSNADANMAPYNDKENFEYIELRNIGTQEIDLFGVQFTQGITFDFSMGSVRFLDPGQSIVIVANLQAFEERYGTNAVVAGAYTGNLSNGGETITLVDATGAVIQSFTYSNSNSTTPPWPQTPHGQGPSLTVIDVNGNYDDPANWRASFTLLGTPGYNEGVDTAPQQAPTNVQAAVSGYTATSTGTVPIVNVLTWTALPDATGYLIERKLGVNGTYAQIGVVSQQAFSDSSLVAGSNYYYEIIGVNAVGAGPASAELSVVIPAIPAAPTAALVTGETSTSISLSWTDNASNEDGFQIYRSTASGPFTLVGSVPADTSAAPSSAAYTDGGLTPGVTYQYEIVAFNIAGASNFATVTTTTRLASPTIVFSQRNGNTATLFFTSPAGVTSYNIYRGTASGQETLLASNVTASPYADSTLQTGVTYYYYVTAVNANAVPASNESAPSNEASPATTGGGAFQWTGGGSNNNWTTAGNWLGGAAPTGNANETIIFPTGASQLASVDNFAAGSNFFFNIIVTGGGYSFTLNNNLVIGAGGILVSAVGADTISAASGSVGIFLAANAPINVAAGALIENAPINELTFTLTLAGAGSDTLNGAITGSGGLGVSAGQGIVNLNGANTYTGPTAINAGSVNIANNTALGNNSAVSIALSATVALSGVVTPGVGLSGQYYSVTPTNADFVDYPTLSAYINTLTPSLSELSSATSLNGTFDFGSDGSSFPAPYNANASDFIAVYTGLFNATTTGSYTFDTGSDDGSMIYIDGSVVVNNNNFQGITVNSGTVTLAAGEHNIVIAYYQGIGQYGLFADVQTPGGALQRLPNSLLSAIAPTNVQIGSLTGAGTIQLGANQITVGGNGTSSTFAGVISGAGALTKVGAGTLILGQPQYSGATTISGGTLQFGDGVNPLSALPTASIADNSSLLFDNPAGAALTYAEPISGSGGLTVIGSGTLYLNATNTYQGATHIAGGIVDALNNAALSTNSAVTVDAGASVTFSGLVNAGLSGTYYNTAPNNPASTAFVSLAALTTYVAGLPVIATDFSSTSNGQNNAGNNFDYGSNGAGFPVAILANPNQFVAVWTGEFNAQAAGTYTFDTGSDDGSMIFIDGNVVVNNNFYQGVTVRSGTVSLTQGYHNIVIAYYEGGGGYGMYADVQTPGGVLQRLPNALLLDSNSQISFGSLAGGGNVTVNSSTAVNLNVGSNNASTTFSGVLAGFTALTKVGTGTLTLSNTNTYFGATAINAGTVVATANGALGSANAPGIVVGTGGALAFSGGVNYAIAEPITISGSGPAGHGAIDNIGGTNSFAGPITVSGTPTIGSDAGSLTLSGNINLGSAGTVTVTGAGQTTSSGVISGTAVTSVNNLTMAGTGTLTLSNTDTYLGNTTVNAGKLLVDGQVVHPTVTVNTGGTLGGHGTVPTTTVHSGGAFAPGDSPGAITVSNLTMTSGSTYKEELAGAAAGTLYDQAIIPTGGAVALGGATLNISLLNGFQPTLGEQFTIINNQSGSNVSGTFSQGSTYSSGGYIFAINYAAGASHNVVLTVTAVPTTVTALSPATGATTGGTTVIITGKGFTAATAVKFGTTNAASYTVNSDTQITAVSPAGTGVVDVTVIAPGGTSPLSIADQFMYAVVTSISLTDHGPNPSTAGNAVSFTVTVSGGAPINAETVTIEDADNANAVVASPTLTGSTVTFNISTLSIGTHHLFAVYGGDTTHLGSNNSTTPVAQVVNPGGVAPAVVSVVVNGGAPQYTDGNGVQVSLAGQNSIVERLLVTFNEAVTLDPGAFTISSNLASFVSLGGIETPNTDPVGLNAPIPVSGSGGTQFILTFLAGSGVNSIPGPGSGTFIKDGVYNLNTIGSHVHANSQTAADNHAGFWALFGSVAADNVVSGNIGDGNSDVLVDTPDAAQFKIAFASENDSSLLPDQAYDAAMDSNLSGVIGTEDAAKFKHNFGTEWLF